MCRGRGAVSNGTVSSGVVIGGATISGVCLVVHLLWCCDQWQ